MSIHRVQLGDREITIVGTAHVSQASVEEVQQVIDSDQPARVCVEIDHGRYRAMTDESRWQNLNIYRVIRNKQGFLLLSNMVLTSFQRRLGTELGVKPGAEMIETVRIAEERGIPIALCDREIQITLRRAWRKAGIITRFRMLSALIGSALSKEKLDASQIEELKEKGALGGMMDELAKYLPAVKEVLIDERDRYLATKVFRTTEKQVVAVVGAGHVQGIIEHLHKLHEGQLQPELADIEHVPKRSVASRVAPWVLPAIILGIFAWGFATAGWDAGLEMLGRWILVNGTLSAVGALVALAHPITILASFLAAPITSMNPTIGVGFVSGLLEAVLRKPRVADFEALQTDLLTFKGFFRNRITRVLLVFFFSSIGSAIGTFVAIPLLFPAVA